MAADHPAKPVLDPVSQGSPKALVRAYHVTGQVQGVGFRWFTSRTAKELEISGTVRNHPDGSVRVHAQGAPSNLDQLEEMLGIGPVAAKVEGVERERPPKETIGEGFRIERPV